MAEYKTVRTKLVLFCGVSNIYLNLKIHKDNIVIVYILQGYVLNWYYTYLLHAGMYRT